MGKVLRKQTGRRARSRANATCEREGHATSPLLEGESFRFRFVSLSSSRRPPGNAFGAFHLHNSRPELRNERPVRTVRTIGFGIRPKEGQGLVNSSFHQKLGARDTGATDSSPQSRFQEFLIDQRLEAATFTHRFWPLPPASRNFGIFHVCFISGTRSSRKGIGEICRVLLFGAVKVWRELTMQKSSQMSQFGLTHSGSIFD